MSYVLIHHTGCGTSRKAIALLDAKGVDYTVRKYINASERLSVAELKDIAAKMGGVGPRAFLREKDAKANDLPETASDAAVFKAMAENPKLIQRPIGILGDKAVLGRPVEKLLEIL